MTEAQDPVQAGADSCSETPLFRAEKITPVRVLLNQHWPYLLSVPCGRELGASNGDMVPHWVLIATAFFDAAPSTVLVLLMALRLSVRPALLAAAGVVALVSRGPRGDRARDIVTALARRSPSQK